MSEKKHDSYANIQHHWQGKEIQLLILIAFFLGLGILAACQPVQIVDEAPTPIPTLIPATMAPINLEPTNLPSFLIESYPAGLPSLSNGSDIYQKNCSNCHGTDGKGLVPNSRDFGDMDYMRGETPLEFYQVITEGRGNDMPGFGEEINSDERWDVAYYLWNFTTTESNLELGINIYTENCETCHGKDGRSMILGAANFTDQRVMANQSPSDLYVTITQGIGSMPAWQSRLSQEERWAVVDYVRTFTYNPEIDQFEAFSEPETNVQSRPECEPYLNISNPYNLDDPNMVTEGESLFLNCVGCHGDDGTGNIPGVPDFSDPAFNQRIIDDPDSLVCSIAEGINSMPGFKENINPEDIWKVLIYINTFRK